MTTTQFPEWLSALGARRVDMSADRAFGVEHTITYPGDVRTATLAGTVKASPDATAELATFTVASPTYNAGENRTFWTVSLSGAQTLALPADTDGNGVEALVQDFILTLSGGMPRRIMGGLFIVSGFVTEPA